MYFKYVSYMGTIFLLWIVMSDLLWWLITNLIIVVFCCSPNFRQPLRRTSDPHPHPHPHPHPFQHCPLSLQHLDNDFKQNLRTNVPNKPWIVSTTLMEPKSKTVKMTSAICLANFLRKNCEKFLTMNAKCSCSKLTV